MALERLGRFREQIGEFGQRVLGTGPSVGASETAQSRWAEELMKLRDRRIRNKDLYRVVNLGPLVHFQTTTDPDTVRRELLNIAELSGPRRQVIAWTSANAAYDIATGKMIPRIVSGTREGPEGQQVPTAGVERYETQIQLFDLIENYPNPSIFLLENFHLALEDPMDKRAMVDTVNRAWDRLRRQNKTVVILSPLGITLPPEIGAACPVVQEVPVNRRERERIVQTMMAETGLRSSNEVAQRIVDATTGLNVLQSHQALQYALLTEWGLAEMAGHVSEWKQKQMAASGRWEALDTKDVPELVGWDKFEARVEAELRYGALQLGSPHATNLYILVGQAGTGKTTMARRMGQKLGWPVYKARVDQWMGQYVGQTEKGFAAAMHEGRANQPCLLLFDEGQRALQSNDQGTAGGTMHRSFGEVLTTIEEIRQKGEQVVTVVTANDIRGLPPEFINRGTVYGVPFPGPETRKAIWRVVVDRFSVRDPRLRVDLGLDEEAIAQATRGMSGRDLENLISLSTVFGGGLISLESIRRAKEHLVKQEDIDPVEIARRTDFLSRIPSVTSDLPGEKPVDILDQEVLPPTAQGPISDQRDRGERRRKPTDDGLTSIPVKWNEVD